MPTTNFFGSPLYSAVFWDNEVVMRLLLENGADVNAKGGRHNVTALHAAVCRGSLRAVRLLLEQGADVNAYNEFFWQSSILCCILG